MTPSDSKPGEKICAICHRDCSTRARTKDDAGRYFCRECIEKTKQARAERRRDQEESPHDNSATPVVAPPAPGSPEDTALDMLAEAVSETAAAPPIPPPLPVDPEGAAGSPRPTRPAIIEPEEEPVAISLEIPGFLKAPWFAFVVPAAVLGGLFAMAFDDPEHTRTFLALHCVYSVIVWLLVLIEAFRHGIGTGLLTLFLPFYILYFVLSVNRNAHLKALFSVAILSTVAMLFLMPDFVASLPAMPTLPGGGP